MYYYYDAAGFPVFETAGGYPDFSSVGAPPDPRRPPPPYAQRGGPGQPGRPPPPPPGYGGPPGGMSPQQLQAMLQARGSFGGPMMAPGPVPIQPGVPGWAQQIIPFPGSPASDDGQLMSPLGLGRGTLTPAVASIDLEAEPQRQFRPERLVVHIVRSAGAGAVGVNLTALKVGENSQLVGSDVLPAETFAPDGFGVRLAMTPATPGVKIICSFTGSIAVPAGETVSISAALIGRALWGPGGAIVGPM